ncbi:hypothetical protein INT44_000189 [Umbelopsis vinacea]|uniref:Mid2 domain-containing protein n=1 Tax=Umbelopsis vinacea TaxID=44442 RepID=A0A8H7PHV0_9FUNG|nr:hypothetical protein INT44_000189 [Umbelopsis vinacea]
MRLLLYLAVALFTLLASVHAAATQDPLGQILAGGADTPPTSTTEHTTASPTHTTTQAPPPTTTTTTTTTTEAHTTTVAPVPTTSAPVVVSSKPPSSSVASTSSALTTSSFIMPSTSVTFVSTSMNATSSLSSATPSNTTAPSDSDSGSSNSKPIIIGSICGFVAIIAAGFGYAFLSKTRRNNRKKRVFGADDDDGMDPSIPAPSPFQRHNESLAPAGAAWESDQKRPLGPPSPYMDYNYPSPALGQNGVRRSPPIAHSDPYGYAQQPPAAGPYYDDHNGYDQQVYYEQYPQQPMEMQHVPHNMQSPQMNQQYQYYGHTDPYNYRQ